MAVRGARTLPGWVAEARPHLPAMLRDQRWFAGKARTITDTAVEDVCAIDAADASLVLIEVAYSDGGRERYPLVLRPERGGPPRDAAADPGVLTALLAACAHQPIATARGGRLEGGDWGAAALELIARPHVVAAPLGRDQSNTSVRVAGSLMLKLFRHLTEGENPELEVGRFLTHRTRFRALAPLEGSLTYVAPSGVPTTLAVVQRWVENEGDGWTHLVNQLSTRGHLTERSLEEVSELGRVTAQLHAALASGSDDAAFAPARVTAADLDRWTGALEERAAESVRLLRHGADSWSGDAKQDADWLRGRLSRLPDAVRARTSTSTDFLLIRVHGDYHLGQTLKTRTGFAVIDFEGEPTRSLEERRQKQSALRDVAGLLRSLDYAVRTACNDDTGAMQDGLRQALLSAYFDAWERTEHAGSILPRPADRRDWLQFFEVEKAMYELAYELNNRPAWAHIPLRWLRQTAARLLQDDSSMPASSR